MQATGRKRYGLACSADWSRVEHVPDRLGHDLRYSVDISKISGELGYAPRMPFEQDLYQYTLMPTHMRTFFEASEFEGAELVRDLPFARGYPVLKLPLRSDAKANMTRRYPLLDARNVVFDLASDPSQRTPIEDAALEARIHRRVATLLAKHDAPAELYRRYALEPFRAAA